MSEETILQITGALASHARGRTLAASFGAVLCGAASFGAASPGLSPSESLPRVGVLFVMGKEFQDDHNAADAWLTWAAKPGRLLVVGPPFRRGPCDVPASWEARPAETLAGGETELGKRLARERKHEIRGSMLPLERNAGQVITAGWRRHPAAGLVAITTLPLWSLSALDHRTACKDWLSSLLEQAGRPPADEASQPETAGVSQAERNPTPDEWAFLLHLCTGPFENEESALSALARSAVHQFAPGCAREALRDLVDLGYATNGNLTAKGERVLLDGPYAAYARALRRQHER